MENITPFVKEFRFRDSDVHIFARELTEEMHFYTYKPIRLLGGKPLDEEIRQELQFFGKVHYIEAKKLEDVIHMLESKDKDKHRKKHALVHLRNAGWEKLLLLGEIYGNPNSLGVYLPSVIKIE
ncbi:hypothetical protein HYT25_02960 [Candidatus Pacearchaeota archaeon]|nr:hypothetical protein [Candidatus Pacearchaeota archaeon]